jgi:hypothetical protein
MRHWPAIVGADNVFAEQNVEHQSVVRYPGKQGFDPHELRSVSIALGS